MSENFENQGELQPEVVENSAPVTDGAEPKIMSRAERRRLGLINTEHTSAEVFKSLELSLSDESLAKAYKPTLSRAELRRQQRQQQESQTEQLVEQTPVVAEETIVEALVIFDEVPAIETIEDYSSEDVSTQEIEVTTQPIPEVELPTVSPVDEELVNADETIAENVEDDEVEQHEEYVAPVLVSEPIELPDTVEPQLSEADEAAVELMLSEEAKLMLEFQHRLETPEIEDFDPNDPLYLEAEEMTSHPIFVDVKEPIQEDDIIDIEDDYDSYEAENTSDIAPILELNETAPLEIHESDLEEDEEPLYRFDQDDEDEVVVPAPVENSTIVDDFDTIVAPALEKENKSKKVKKEKKSKAPKEKVSKFERIFGWFLNVLIAVLAILVSVVVVLPFAMGGTGLAVVTGSMRPSINPGDMVIVTPIEREELQVGDIITFQRESGVDTLITHRLVEINEDGTFTTKGDDNNTYDAPIVFEQIKGHVALRIPLLGYLENFSQGGRAIPILIFVGGAILVISFVPKLFIKDEEENENGDAPVVETPKAPELEPAPLALASEVEFEAPVVDYLEDSETEAIEESTIEDAVEYGVTIPEAKAFVAEIVGEKNSIVEENPTEPALEEDVI